ncbi:MAG TPA: chemotaxis protein CheA [Gemmatimonadaceae bacterium]|nr:chemotaxis protein CheA [Gemmatimonadaceae bacterium]
MATYTLDDALALFVQLEPGDKAGLRELRQGLWPLVASPAITPAARGLLADAVLLIDDPRMGRKATRDACFDELRQVLERAATAGDPLPMAEPSAPVAAPPSEPAAVAIDRLAIPADADASLLGDFVTESQEYLEASEAALLRLETDAEDAESINVIFRAFHTIKGTSAFLGLDPIAELAHHAETLFSRVRERELACTGGYADLALRAVDVMKELIAGVRRALGGEAVPLPGEYAAVLQVLLDPEAAGVSAAGSSPVLDAEGRGPKAEGPVEGRGPRAEGPVEGRVPKADGPADGRAPRLESKGETQVRVRTDRLDKLIEMVGELVIAQAMISQDPTLRASAHVDLARKVGHAEKIVRELQDLSMGMRMVPLKGPMQKIARLVRDLAHRSGKLVEFVSEGEETEIDRNLVDLLTDPLVHMARNALDHGLEAPEERVAAGKSRAGTVRIAAYHAGGNVVVELHDDGRGLSRERIVRKAVAVGLIASDDGMSDADVWQLIFAPGFSTAEKVTDLSGRGVGMDVVRRNIDAARGRVEITSQAGVGTSFTLRLPLTLAITDGMLIRVGGERYIVPTAQITLSFRPEAGAVSTYQGRAEMVLHREQLLPVVRLHRLFGVSGAQEDPSQALLMIVGDGAHQVALLVDELLSQQQVVAKSLGDGIGRIRGLAGGAILGDGRVGLILDVPEVVAIARHGVAETVTRAA